MRELCCGIPRCLGYSNETSGSIYSCVQQLSLFDRSDPAHVHFLYVRNDGEHDDDRFDLNRPAANNTLFVSLVEPTHTH